MFTPSLLAHFGIITLLYQIRTKIARAIANFRQVLRFFTSKNAEAAYDSDSLRFVFSAVLSDNARQRRIQSDIDDAQAVTAALQLDDIFEVELTVLLQGIGQLTGCDGELQAHTAELVLATTALLFVKDQDVILRAVTGEGEGCGVACDKIELHLGAVLSIGVGFGLGE